MSKWDRYSGHTRIVVSVKLENTGKDAEITWYQGNIPEVFPEKRSSKFRELRKRVVELEGDKLLDSESTRRWKFNDFNE
jgi:hypothetical protein